MLKPIEMYDLNKTLAGKFLSLKEYPWEILPEIKSIILTIGEKLGDEYERISENVWVHKTAKIAPTAYIGSPCIIGEDTEVRHCAFIRGSALIGKNCVIGNSTEVKNSILFDNVQVPHYNYVGDSVLGYKSHLGAGAVTSNVKSDRTVVKVKNGEKIIDTKLKKFGAMVGDNVEVGCNSVLNPGTVIGRNCTVYPLSCVRGVIPDSYIYKSADNIIRKE